MDKINKNMSISFLIYLIAFLTIGTICFTFFVRSIQAVDFPGEYWTIPLRLDANNLSSYTSSNDHSIAVDTNGYIHLVVEGKSTKYPSSGEIFYWTNIGGTWSWQNISNTDQASFGNSNPTIALDSNNKAHVVWTSGPLGVNRDIMYSNNVGGSWTTPYNVTQTNSTVYEVSPIISFDSNGVLHIAYFDAANSDIYHISKDLNGVWSAPEKVNNNPYSYNFINPALNLEIDSHNNLYILYSASIGASHPKIYLVENSGEGWTAPYNISQISSMGNDWNDYSSLAIDNDDNIHIAWGYRNEASTLFGVKYAEKIDGVWSETVFLNATIFNVGSLSITSDLENHVHLAYQQEQKSLADYEIYYTNNVNGHFMQPVNATRTPNNSESAPRIVIDNSGYVNMIYYKTTTYNSVRFVKSALPVAPETPAVSPTGLRIPGFEMSILFTLSLICVGILIRKSHIKKMNNK
jgi:hypothetical protein